MKLDDFVNDLYKPITKDSMKMWDPSAIYKEAKKYDEDLFKQLYLGEWNSGSEATYITDKNSGAWLGIDPATTGGQHQGTWTTDHTTIFPLGGTSVKYTYTSLEEEDWTEVPGDELGIVYIEGDEIKLKTRVGKIVTIGRLDDSDDFLPLEVIAAKKKLLEDPEPQEEA